MSYTFAGYFSLAAAVLLCYMAIRDRKPLLSERDNVRAILEAYNR
jgi:hypothetical protein